MHSRHVFDFSITSLFPSSVGRVFARGAHDRCFYCCWELSLSILHDFCRELDRIRIPVFPDVFVYYFLARYRLKRGTARQHLALVLYRTYCISFCLLLQSAHKIQKNTCLLLHSISVCWFSVRHSDMIVFNCCSFRIIKARPPRISVVLYLRRLLRCRLLTSSDYVDHAVRHVMMRQGVLGVTVSIMLPHDPTVRSELGGRGRLRLTIDALMSKRLCYGSEVLFTS